VFFASNSIGRVLRRVAIWLPLALVTFGGAFVAAAVEFAPGASPVVVAFYPPWWKPERVLATASDVAPVGGVAAAGWAIGVVANRPGVVGALRQSGALFVADGRAFPACFASSSRTRR
jgi:hypothetical protein